MGAETFLQSTHLSLPAQLWPGRPEWAPTGPEGSLALRGQGGQERVGQGGRGGGVGEREEAAAARGEPGQWCSERGQRLQARNVLRGRRGALQEPQPGHGPRRHARQVPSPSVSCDEGGLSPRGKRARPGEQVRPVGDARRHGDSPGAQARRPQLRKKAGRPASRFRTATFSARKRHCEDGQAREP